MSAIAEPLRGAPAAIPRARRAGAVWARRESLIVFALAACVYIGLGLWTTVHLHVVYTDAESRLNHAYLVWWNRPAKLARPLSASQALAAAMSAQFEQIKTEAAAEMSR